MEHPFSPRGIPNATFVDLADSFLGQLQPVRADWPDSSCLLADIGEYLVRCFAALAYISERLVNEQHINDYAAQSVAEMKDETDFSDLRPLDYFDQKHLSLKSVAFVENST